MTERVEMSETGAERAARLKWDSEADAYNQWDSLGWDERILLIIAEVEAPAGAAGPAEAAAEARAAAAEAGR
jgi:hypothetical protein